MDKEVFLIDQVYEDVVFDTLVSVSKSVIKTSGWDDDFGRYGIATPDGPKGSFLIPYHERLVPLARDIFKSDTLLPTYALLVHYESDKADLLKHKDSNACTYTIDICLYQNTPWPLWIEGKPYTLEENQAVGFYGEEQLHWREQFPNPETNEVGMLFLHFVEPDHWWFNENN